MFANTGAMRVCAPEFGFLGSIKYTVKGARSIILVSFAALRKAAEELHALEHPTQQMSLQHICGCLSEVKDVEVLSALLQKCKCLRFCTADADSVIIIPWGYVVAEATLNSQTVLGLKWSFASDSVDTNVLALADFLLPKQAGTHVKSGTAVAFLLKLIGFAGAASHSEASEGLKKAVAKFSVVKSVGGVKRLAIGPPGPPAPPKQPKAGPSAAAAPVSSGGAKAKAEPRLENKT